MDWREWDALRETRSREFKFGLLRQAAALKRWWIGLPVSALVLAGAVLFLQPARYSAEAQISIGPRTGVLVGSESSVALLDAGTASGQAQLIASRDLARRAIKDLGLEDNPEFDPVAKGVGPGFRALIFFGIMRNPARKSPEDRVLEAYADRLRVSGPGSGGLVTIAFQSEDAELAARAANRIAELYLELRADATHAADLAPKLDARIISRAVEPNHPLYPRGALLAVSGAAILVMAFGALVSIVLPRGEARGGAEVPLEQPRTLGQVRAFARLTGAPGLRPEINVKLDPPPTMEAETGGDDPNNEQATAKIVTRILAASARAGGPRDIRQDTRQGIRIIATSLEATGAASSVMLDLARGLAREGRSIVIGLDESGLLDFESSTASAPDGHPPGAEPALGDLLAGTASFAEVIRRDPASRLHFLPVGGGELDLLEFANMIDALAGIYDFIVTIAPPLERNGTARTLAAKADVVLLATPEWPRSGAVFEAEAQLIESGAREVFLLGIPAQSPWSRGLDAA